MPFNIEAAKKAGYTEDEILQHLTQSRKFDVDGAVSAGYTKPELIGHLASTPATPRETPEESAARVGGAPARFTQGVARGLGKVVKGTTELVTGLATNPLSTIKTATIDAQSEMWRRAKAAYNAGEFSRASGYLLATGIPLIGPMAAGMGEQIGGELEKPDGDVAGAIGETVGQLGPLAIAPGVRAWSRVPPTPPAWTTLKPTAMEAGASVPARFGRTLARTPIGLGPAAEVVQKRQPLVKARVEATADMIAPSIPQLPGSMEVTAQQQAIRHGVSGVSRATPEGLGRGVARQLKTRADAARQDLRQSWTALDTTVQELGVKPDVSYVQKASSALSTLPEEARQFLATTLPPDVMALLERGRKAGVPPSTLGSGRRSIDLTALGEEARAAVIGQLAEVIEPSWQAVHEAKTAVGARFARARAKNPTGGEARALGSILASLNQALMKNMPPELRKSFLDLNKSQTEYYRQYRQGLPRKIADFDIEKGMMRGVAPPSTTVSLALRSSPEEIQHLKGALGTQGTKTLEQGIVNEVFRGHKDLNGVYETLVGKKAGTYRTILTNYDTVVGYLRQRLQRGGLEDLVKKSIVGGPRGAIDGAHLADLLEANTATFKRLGMSDTHLTELGKLGDDVRALQLARDVGGGVQGSATWHSYYQIGSALGALTSLLTGHPQLAATLTATLAAERMLVDAMLRPQGVGFLRALVGRPKAIPANIAAGMATTTAFRPDQEFDYIPGKGLVPRAQANR